MNDTQIKSARRKAKKLGYNLRYRATDLAFAATVIECTLCGGHCDQGEEHWRSRIIWVAGTLEEVTDWLDQQTAARAEGRNLFGEFLRSYYDGEVAITDAPGDSLPVDPATLIGLGITASEYAGTSAEIARLVGFEPHDGALVIDVVAATLAVTR